MNAARANLAKNNLRLVDPAPKGQTTLQFLPAPKTDKGAAGPAMKPPINIPTSLTIATLIDGRPCTTFCTKSVRDVFAAHAPHVVIRSSKTMARRGFDVARCCCCGCHSRH